MIPVLWISRHDDIRARGYADQGLLEDVFAHEVWTPQEPLQFEHVEVHGDDWPEIDGAAVILPARHHASPEDVAWFNERLDALKWALVILAGDEDWEFDWRSVWREGSIDRRRVWIMQPRAEHASCDGLIPGGWYAGEWGNTRDLIRGALYPFERTSEAGTHRGSHSRPAGPDRTLDWFFGGQVTHERRVACVTELKGVAPVTAGKLIETDGYLKGSRPEYFENLVHAKIIPSPSGPMSVDTARTFEALEAGCVPIVDLRKPKGDQFDYWNLLFGTNLYPFPAVHEWNELPGVMYHALKHYDEMSVACFAFWQEWKRRISLALDDQIREIAHLPRQSEDPSDLVTVIVTTSPTEKHPSMEDLEETIETVRAQLPTAEIILVADGVRPEDSDLRAAYTEYLQRVLWKCNFEWRNVLPVVAWQWGHQAHCVRLALDYVRTPLVFMMEHDTPLTWDRSIQWDAMCELCSSGKANEIRLSITEEIHPDHRTIMLDSDVQMQLTRFGDLPVMRTKAHWQRPHLARTDFYRDRVMPLFTPESRTMIEDFLYSVVTSDVADRGEAAWWDWRIWIYTPQGGMLRSRHLDSRGSRPKYEMKFPPRT